MKPRKLVYEPLSDEWIHGKDLQPEEGSIVDVLVPTVDPDTGKIDGHCVRNCWIFAGEVLSGNPPQVIRGSVFWRPAAEQDTTTGDHRILDGNRVVINVITKEP